MQKLLCLGILVVLVVLGGIAQRYVIRRFNSRLEFTVEYREEFIKLYTELQKTKAIDASISYYLIENQNKIQLELGKDGVASVYRNPMAGIQIQDYPLFLNFFNELRNYITDYDLFGDQIYWLFTSCDESLVKHIGVLKEAIGANEKKFYNPLYCLSKGIGVVLSLPIKLLEWSGIITRDRSGALINSRLSIIINGIIALLSLTASVITIASGWDTVIELIK